jgi:phosphorylcholine metabolism protein LicD
MNRENAAKLLRDVHSVLVGMGKKHFIADGTLLGAVREGDFIGHDCDMDMGVFWEEWTPLDIFVLNNLMSQRNIMPKFQFGNFTHHFEISYARDGIKIDIFFYRRQGEFRVFHAFRRGGKDWATDVITYFYRAEHIEELEPIQFSAGTFPAPKKKVEILEAKYGPDWQTPQIEWDWADGPHNKLNSPGNL